MRSVFQPPLASFLPFFVKLSLTPRMNGPSRAQELMEANLEALTPTSMKPFGNARHHVNGRLHMSKRSFLLCLMLRGTGGSESDGSPCLVLNSHPKDKSERANSQDPRLRCSYPGGSQVQMQEQGRQGGLDSSVHPSLSSVGLSDAQGPVDQRVRTLKVRIPVQKMVSPKYSRYLRGNFRTVGCYTNDLGTKCSKTDQFIRA